MVIHLGDVAVSVKDSVMEDFRDSKTHIDLGAYWKPKERSLPLSLSHIILCSLLRNYVIRKVKAPLKKAIASFAEGYPKHRKFLETAIIVRVALLPEPTRENCIHPNTLKLFDIRDRFFESFGEDAFFKAAWKLLIVEYEHDPYYCFRIDWVIEYTREMGWDWELPLEHNLSILIAAKDKFFEYQVANGTLFQAIWQISIVEYQTIRRGFVDWVLEEINKSDWKPRRRDRPAKDWKEVL